SCQNHLKRRGWVMKISSKLQNASANRQTAVAAERTDEELVQSIAGGDKFAMQILFIRQRDKINRFIHRFTRDEGLAEDALSEVFLDVWRKAGSFEGGCQVATWLLAIARNKTLALLRQRKFVALDETEAGSIEDPADNPESALDTKSYST